MTRRRWGLAALGSAVLWLPAMLGLAAPGDAVPVPPLPPQPGLASPSCTSPAPGRAPWATLLDRRPATDATPELAPMTVDPTMPCRLYRVSDDATVQRSTDSGVSWQTVLHDEATPVTQAPPALPAPLPSPSRVPGQNARQFQALRATVSGSGAVFVAEEGNGDGVVASSDAGRTWRLTDTGLAQQRVQRLTVSPSDPSVLYAEVAGATAQGRTTAAGAAATPPLVTGVYVSHDAGQTWSTASTAGQLAATALGAADTRAVLSGSGGGVPILVVDPAASAHLWMLAATEGELTTAAGQLAGNYCFSSSSLLESADSGATWKDDGAVPLGTGASGGCAQPNQLVVSRRPDGGRRLLVTTDTVPYLLVSDDGGADWKAVGLGVGQLGQVTALVDPAAPSRVALVAIEQSSSSFPVNTAHLDAFFSPDGFLTWSELPGVQVNWTYVAAVGLLYCRSSAGGCQYTSQAILPPGTSTATQLYQDALSVDRGGRFYVALGDGCADAACSAPQLFTTPATARVRLLRLDAAGARSLPATCAAAGCRAGKTATGPVSGQPVTSQGEVMPTLFTCPLVAVTGAGNDLFAGASVGFDGQDVLYVDRGYPKQLSDGSLVGVIHKLRPYPDCADDGDIQVSYDPNQFKSSPVFGDLAYDNTRNVIWMAVDDYNDQFRYKALEVIVTRAVSGPLTVSSAVGVVRWSAGPYQGTPNCGWSYDWTTDTILTCQAQGRTTNRVRPMDGSPVPSCLDAYLNAPGQNGWTVGAPGVLYIEEEEPNTTMQAMETRTCHVFATYVHRPMGETTAEDDQLACDGVTFGEGSGYPAPTSVIWERDEAANVVSAFVIPDAYCPWPTTTHFLGPTRVERGSVASLCAGLEMKGRNLPLRNQPLDFHLGGIDAGIQQTSPSGVACVPATVDLPPGRYPVEVSFAGNHAYLPSEDVGTLTVWQPVPQVVAAPVVNLPLPPAPPPPPAGGPPPVPGPVNAPAPATVESIAPVAQAQPQPQPVSQAMGQPVAVGVRQHEVQPQLSFSLAPEAHREGLAEGYAMTAMSTPQGSGSLAGLVVGGALGLLAAGFGLAMRLAHRTAVARAVAITRPRTVDAGEAARRMRARASRERR